VPLCHLVEAYRRFGETYCLHLQFKRVRPVSKLKSWQVSVSILTFSSTVNMEVSSSSETWSLLLNYTASHPKELFLYRDNGARNLNITPKFSKPLTAVNGIRYKNRYRIFKYQFLAASHAIVGLASMPSSLWCVSVYCTVKQQPGSIH
jgi:hypothetical protein